MKRRRRRRRRRRERESQSEKGRDRENAVRESENGVGGKERRLEPDRQGEKNERGKERGKKVRTGGRSGECKRNAGPGSESCGPCLQHRCVRNMFPVSNCILVFSLYSRSSYCSAKGILQSRDQWKMIGRSDTGSCAREGRLGYRPAAGRTGPGPGVRCTGCGTWERGGRGGPLGQLPLSLWLSVYR